MGPQAVKFQRCYGGVRLLNSVGPSVRNIQRLDAGAIPMIAQMAATGLQVDLSHFARMETALQQDMERITAEVQEIAGHYVNLDSGAQVSHLLFKELGLKQARRKLTKSGDRESTESEVLVAIQHQHPVVAKILDFKELSKLSGTYVQKMPQFARRSSHGVWRIYPNFTTTRTPSGRLAAKNPNLLAMPSRTKRGREIRKGFITDEGWTYLSCDFSQIEPRMAAHISGDAALTHIYETQQDIYSDFATRAFTLTDERYQNKQGEWIYPTVDGSEHRRPSKICTLASLYQVTAPGLMEQMPVMCANCGKPTTSDKPNTPLHDCHRFAALWTEPKCQDLINSFYATYPGLPRMQREQNDRARQHSMTWDVWGRLLHVAAVRSVHPWVVSTALREAANMPIQSSAAGAIKLAMAQIHDECAASGAYDVCHPLLQIHDELLFEVRESEAAWVADYMKGVFEGVVRLRVPLKASTGTARTWGDAK